MGANKEDLTSGRKGMMRDAHPSTLDNQSYTIMLNGNYEDTDGNFIQLQNEHSNLLCTGFKDGYKVVGFKVDLRNDKVYFFLTNPDTGLSEIGYVKNITCIDDAIAMEVDCGCDVKVILQEPLEKQVQVALCNYETLIADCEEYPCLKFDVCTPFKEGNIQFKQEKCGDTLYFTDGVNPPRYLQLENLEIYFEEGRSTDCDTPIVTECLDCNKMRIFPLYKKPCLDPKSIQTGGNLQAGMYEVILAYSDESGNELSPYYSVTQPIPIFDLNNNILDQSLLGYETSLGIRLEVSDLDQSFSSYKVAVIFRNGLDGAVRYFEEGVHLISDDSIVLTSLKNKRETTQQNILIGRTTYETTDGMASGNGYLFQYGLTAKPEMNLQPVVNLMGAFAKWTTVRAKEDIYKDPIQAAKYKSHMRDETYPYGIQFFTTDGYASAAFPFIARPFVGDEKDAVGGLGIDTTLDSFERCAPNCSENDRDVKWKLFNTATYDGNCTTEEEDLDNSETYTTTIEVECIIEDTDIDGNVIKKQIDILTGSICLTTPIPDLDLVSFLNANYDEIIDPTSALSLLNTGNVDYTALVEIMDDSDDDYPLEVCTPESEGDCTLVADVSQNKLLPYDTDALTMDTTPGGELDYTVIADTSPGIYEALNVPALELCARVTEIAGVPQLDTDFITDFMVPTSIVYKTSNANNAACSSSIAMARVTPATTNIYNLVFLRNGAALSQGAFADATYSGLEDQATPASPAFFQGLHLGARWYTGTFLTQPSMVIQTSALSLCSFTDDLSTSNFVRISTYVDCTSTVAIQSEIVDLSADNLMTIDNGSGVYTSDTFFISVEPAARVDVEYSIQLINPSLQIDLTGASGSANIDVGGVIALATFNTTLAQTAIDFAAANPLMGATTVTASGDSLIFTNPDPLPVITITPVSVLDGIIVLGQVDIDIDGNSFVVDYNVLGLTNTAADFLTAHQVAIEALGMTVGVTTDTIELRGSLDQYNNTTTTSLIATLDGTITLDREIYLTTPPCGCFAMALKTATVKYCIGFQDLSFYKQMLFEGECEISVPKYNICEPSPHQHGKFGYVESIETYPCNNELYDSSNLLIKPADLTTETAALFETYYTNGVDGNGDYIFAVDGDGALVDFKDRPIRHYKYPCNIVSPFMETSNRGDFQETFVFPIGFDLDAETVNSFLDIAVTNLLITPEERAKITKYEILRGDRRTHKSIVAKGLAFDMYKYQEEGKDLYYPNFPYNDLGKDELHGINHTFGGTSQNRFTFHSPDTHFSKPVLGTEVKLEGYQFGKSEGKFTQVTDHPTWVILGQPAYLTAALLTGAEIALEIITVVGTYMMQSASAPPLSQTISTPLAIAFGISTGLALLFRAGSIRQKWLTTFKGLGEPTNFAYYYTSYGFYNKFLPNTSLDNTLRAMCTSRYLDEGRIAVTDEVSNGATKINNVDREKSVYIGLGDDLGFDYASEYYKFDSDFNKSSSSRYLSSSEGCNDKELNRNIASPYLSLKNYIPDQYGRIDSVKWLTTSLCGDLTKTGECRPAFWGDVFISRFSWKRKMPMFLVDAVNTAPLVPFSYEIHKNIPSLKYYVNYETAKVGDPGFGDYIFPTNRTDTDFMDCFPDGNGFYIKPPAKFYLYFYGIPYFLVESEINSWLRYGKREKQERFYPQESDYVNWTQETNVSIREPNQFHYNPVYSLSPTKTGKRILPETYDKALYDCIYDAPNGVIYSEPDVSENNISDPWLVFNLLTNMSFQLSMEILLT